MVWNTIHARIGLHLILMQRIELIQALACGTWRHALCLHTHTPEHVGRRPNHGGGHVERESPRALESLSGGASVPTVGCASHALTLGLGGNEAPKTIMDRTAGRLTYVKPAAILAVDPTPLRSNTCTMQ